MTGDIQAQVNNVIEEIHLIALGCSCDSPIDEVKEMLRKSLFDLIESAIAEGARRAAYRASSPED
tara:strand:+ start:4565 stop:4759 length:195 start_codon:yes stop_codon:yes gene_type:complete